MATARKQHGPCQGKPLLVLPLALRVRTAAGAQLRRPTSALARRAAPAVYPLGSKALRIALESHGHWSSHIHTICPSRALTVMARPHGGGAAVDKDRSAALAGMDLVRILRAYVQQMVDEVPGYTALLLDRETMRVISTLYGRTARADPGGGHSARVAAHAAAGPSGAAGGRENEEHMELKVRAGRCCAYGACVAAALRCCGDCARAGRKEAAPGARRPTRARIAVWAQAAGHAADSGRGGRQRLPCGPRGDALLPRAPRQAVVFVRPTRDNISLLKRELRQPRFQSYHLCESWAGLQQRPQRRQQRQQRRQAPLQQGARGRDSGGLQALGRALLGERHERFHSRRRAAPGCTGYGACGAAAPMRRRGFAALAVERRLGPLPHPQSSATWCPRCTCRTWPRRMHPRSSCRACRWVREVLGPLLWFGPGCAVLGREAAGLWDPHTHPGRAAVPTPPSSPHRRSFTATSWRWTPTTSSCQPLGRTCS
jgi:hypothetical protein